MKKVNIWDAVYDELSADNSHEARGRKVSASEVSNGKRFRFDDEIEFNRNDGPNKTNHLDLRNAWITNSGFKLKPRDEFQKKFAFIVADRYSCKIEEKNNFLYLHCLEV